MCGALKIGIPWELGVEQRQDEADDPNKMFMKLESLEFGSMLAVTMDLVEYCRLAADPETSMVSARIVGANPEVHLTLWQDAAKIETFVVPCRKAACRSSVYGDVRTFLEHTWRSSGLILHYHGISGFVALAR